MEGQAELEKCKAKDEWCLSLKDAEGKRPVGLEKDRIIVRGEGHLLMRLKWMKGVSGLEQVVRKWIKVAVARLEVLYNKLKMPTTPSDTEKCARPCRSFDVIEGTSGFSPVITGQCRAAS